MSMTPTPDEICERLRDLRAYRTKVYNCAGDAVDAALSDAKATIERLSAEKAEWQRQLGHDLPAWSTRQARVDLRTPLDTVFAGAIAAIETWGAHPDLTSAQSLVSRAWSFINRWIEEGASGASDEARAALGKDGSDE